MYYSNLAVELTMILAYIAGGAFVLALAVAAWKLLVSHPQ